LPGRRVLLGLIAVAVGVAFFLDRTGGINEILPTLRKWWPVLLIAFGIGNLVRSAPRPWGVLGPLLVVGAGAVLLLVTFGRLGRDDYPILWPAALILAGFFVALAGADWADRRQPYQSEVRQLILLRGKRLVSRTRRFWRAGVTVIFGSFELDLREARLNTPAIVNVNVFFGSVDIIVAENLTVEHRRPFLLDRFGVHASVLPTELNADLTISSLVLFGRVTVSRVTVGDGSSTAAPAS
jgi:hypothetical protein